MSAVIQEASPVVQLFTENTADQNARRWMWSASLTEDVSHYKCGHETINRMALMPLDTFDSLIPTEVPARWVDAGGLETDVSSPLGSRFFVYTEPRPAGTPFGIQAVNQTGLRKTAAQLAHDLTFGLNTLESRGIGEITAFQGMFADSTAELSKLYSLILPVEHRVTLVKAIAWFQGGAVDAVAKIPLAKAALKEFTKLALEAEMFILGRVDKAEAEVKQYLTTGDGKRRLDEFDRHCLKELERTEAALLSVKQGVDSNRALGKELGGEFAAAIAQVMEQQNASKAASLAEKENVDLRAKLEALEKKLSKSAKES